MSWLLTNSVFSQAYIIRILISLMVISNADTSPGIRLLLFGEASLETSSFMK
jgi:hypothetical protein